MSERDDTDPQLKSAFTAAREHDRESAPGFQQVRNRAAAALPVRGSFRLGFVAGGVTSLIVVALSIWIVFEEPQVLRRITGQVEPAPEAAESDDSSEAGARTKAVDPSPAGPTATGAAEDVSSVTNTVEDQEPAAALGRSGAIPLAGSTVASAPPAGAEVSDGGLPGSLDPGTPGRNIPADTVTIGLPGDEPQPEPEKFQLDPALRKAPLPKIEEQPSPDVKPGAFVTKSHPATKPGAVQPDRSRAESVADTRSLPERKRFTPQHRQPSGGGRVSDTAQALADLGEFGQSGSGTSWSDMGEMLRSMDPVEARQSLRIFRNSFNSREARIGFPLLEQYLDEQSPSTEIELENPFIETNDNPLSEFPLVLDTASWVDVRSFLERGELPPHRAVRIDELVNYFPYDYSRPRGREDFAVDVEVAACPWNPDHRLARIGIQPRDTPPLPANVTALVQFNAMEVGSYRLIGSRSDAPAAEIDDEPGVDDEAEPLRNVTMLYEIVPRDPGQPAVTTFHTGVQPIYWSGNQTGELFTLTLNYEPGNRRRSSMMVPLVDDDLEFAAASPDFKFAAAVAAFGLLLADSPYKGELSYDQLRRLISQDVPPMRGGYRGELFDLVTRAQTLVGGGGGR